MNPEKKEALVKKLKKGLVYALVLSIVMIATYQLRKVERVNSLVDEINCRYRKDSNACVTLGRLAGSQQEWEKVAFYFGKACDLDDAKTCTLLGTLMIKQKELPNAQATAVSSYQKACDLNEIDACMVLGVMFKDGKDIIGTVTEKSAEKALKYFQKGCDHHLADACVMLGDLWMNGAENLPKDQAKAVTALSAACNLKVGAACDAAIVTINGNAKGILVAEGKPDAIPLAQKGCALERTGSCAYLGDITVSGKGVEKSVSKGREYLKKSCSKSPPDNTDVMGEACHALGVSFQTQDEKSDPQAFEAFKAACDLKYAQSCTALAKFYHQGITVPKSAEKAGELFLLGCNAGDKEACLILTKIAEAKEKELKAKAKAAKQKSKTSHKRR